MQIIRLIAEERTDGRTDGRTNEWVNGQMDRGADGQIDRRTRSTNDAMLDCMIDCMIMNMIAWRKWSRVTKIAGLLADADVCCYLLLFAVGVVSMHDMVRVASSSFNLLTIIDVLFLFHEKTDGWTDISFHRDARRHMKRFIESKS